MSEPVYFRLPCNATKAQELAHYKAFLDGLEPGTYLYGLLGHTLPVIEGDIRSDLCLDPIGDLVTTRRLYAEELAQAFKTLHGVKEDIRRAERHLDAVKDELATIKHRARKLYEGIP